MVCNVPVVAIQSAIWRSVEVQAILLSLWAISLMLTFLAMIGVVVFTVVALNRLFVWTGLAPRPASPITAHHYCGHSQVIFRKQGRMNNGQLFRS